MNIFDTLLIKVRQRVIALYLFREGLASLLRQENHSDAKPSLKKFSVEGLQSICAKPIHARLQHLEICFKTTLLL